MLDIQWPPGRERVSGRMRNLRLRRPWTLRRRSLVVPALDGGGDLAGTPCLVHLVRAANGLRSLREFASTLRRYDAGVEYELVLALKGFPSRDDAEPYLREVSDLCPTPLFFADAGFDVGVFLGVAGRLRRSRYCFLNSHVRLVGDGWLAKLDSVLRRPGVGVVGPFGSWASSHSWLRYSMGLPSFYSNVLPPRSVARAQLLEIELDQRRVERRSALRTAYERLWLLARMPEELVDFEPFPDHHLRTSAFMITHAALSEMRLFKVRSKMDAYALESGVNSITRQAEQMGLQALIVDSEGVAHERGEWDRSGTLWQGDQGQLLIADNRTLSYERGDATRKRLLAALAWGRPVEHSPSAQLR